MSFAQFLRLLKILALAVLILGGAGAAFIWHAAAGQTETDPSLSNPVAPLSTLDSRRASRDMQINFGQSELLWERAQQLLHGKPLAKTVATLSLLASGGLFLLAIRLKQ